MESILNEFKENVNPKKVNQTRYAPRQPWSNYFIWLQENMQIYIDKYGRRDYLRYAIIEWKNMSEKEKLIWTNKSDKDKRRYQREMIEYNQFVQQNNEKI
ncbi:HMG box domain-containing protein [Meloidogyne graminicola]|uniref:HMG box domain-containing protein n=1 Tax=Meloidogyne graminicola TaxID=189291 RepID=A0A8S9ZZF0_9BILA|nr:HMG box domain-containing protein [Meloidogyne graminicola]